MKLSHAVRAFLVGLIASLSFGFVSTAISASSSMISLEQLEEMFQSIRTKSPTWNIHGDMLWGYFFTDTDRKKLEPLKRQLVDDGYHFVGLYPTDDHTTFFLHVEKIEHHTPQSLYERNKMFYRLAEKYGVESYDGMDVGPVQQ
jgi:hypothetical protein